MIISNAADVFAVLLVMEGNACTLALLKNAKHPFMVHRPGLVFALVGLAASDHPINAHAATIVMVMMRCLWVACMMGAMDYVTWSACVTVPPVASPLPPEPKGAA